MGGIITVKAEDPTTEAALSLMDELSDVLQSITGDSGRSSFDVMDVCVERSVFAIAKNGAGDPVGCGAIRPIDKETAEVKRMYAKSQASGVGSAVLAFLEEEALKLGYKALWLETRRCNERAVAFYEARGYRRMENYGKYAGRTNSVCFEKKLTAS